MAKRLRSLGSYLWETDEPVALDDWLETRHSACCCGKDLQIKALEQEIQRLEDLTRDLHLRLKVASLPMMPTLTVKNPSLSRKQQADPWYWLSLVPQHIADLERLKEEIIPQLQSSSFAANHVVFDICEATIPSAILDHCELSINSLSSKFPAVFKIGITRNPVERWQKGYGQDKGQQWFQMKVLVILPEAVSLGFVEAALIRRFQSTPGNMNVRRGGEGVDLSGAGPYFAYVVFRCLAPPKKAK